MAQTNKNPKMYPRNYNGGLKFYALDCIASKSPFGTPAPFSVERPLTPPAMKGTKRIKGVDPDNMGERSRKIQGYRGSVDE